MDFLKLKALVFNEGKQNDRNIINSYNTYISEVTTMVNRVKKLRTKKGELLRPDFALNREPYAYQLTVHITNLLKTYPDSKKFILDAFKLRLKYDQDLEDPYFPKYSSGLTQVNIIVKTYTTN